MIVKHEMTSRIYIYLVLVMNLIENGRSYRDHSVARYPISKRLDEREYMGQAWCLIVSIPDLRPLSHFATKLQPLIDVKIRFCSVS